MFGKGGGLCFLEELDRQNPVQCHSDYHCKKISKEGQTGDGQV